MPTKSKKEKSKTNKSKGINKNANMQNDSSLNKNSLDNSITSKMKIFFKELYCRSKKNKKPDLSNDLVSEGEIINNIGSFSEKTIEDIMIPRSDIVAIEIGATFEELCELIIKHTHTRTLVYKEHLDNIIGFIHIKDLFEVAAKSTPKSTSFNLKQLIRKPIVSPHSMKLIDLLTQMKKNRTHIAIIVDEYGGTDGLVTIHNIIEEIVGDIDDEHDTDNNEDYKIVKPGLIISNSRVEIEELEAVLKVKLKSENGEFDTIGGLIMARSGSVPEKGQIIPITDDVIAEILEATPRTIKQIKITYKPS